MARPGGNPNLKGNKNSGRRPISEEIIERARQKNFKELSKELVSRHLEAMLLDPDSNKDEVRELALPIVLKDMAEKQEHSGTLQVGRFEIINPDANIDSEAKADPKTV